MPNFIKSENWLDTPQNKTNLNQIVLLLHNILGGQVSGDHVEQGGGTQLGPPLIIVHQLHDLVGDH